MNFGTLMLSTLSYCAIMATSYVLLFGLSYHLFKKIRIYYELTLGFVLATFTIFALMASSAIGKTPEEKRIGIYLQISSLIMIGIFISPYSMYPFAIASFIFTYLISKYTPNLFFSELTIQEIGIILVSYGLFMILATCAYFIKNKFPKYLWFILATATTILIFLINTLIQIKTTKINTLLTYIVWFAGSMLLFAVAAITDRVHNHAIRLRDLLEGDDEFYIASKGVMEKFGRYIYQNKYSKGILFTYFITQYDLLDNVVSPQIRDFIWTTINNQVKASVEEKKINAFFFNDTYKTNAVFIPLDNLNPEQLKIMYDGNLRTSRTNEDLLKPYSELFSKITQSYSIGEYRIGIKLRVVASIYGVQTNSFANLVESNSFFIQNKEKLVDKNIVYVINPSEYLYNLFEMRKLKSLNSITGITNSSILYEPIYSNVDKKIIGQFLNYIVDGDVVFPLEKYGESFQIIKDYGLYSMFFRYLGFKALKDTNGFMKKNNDNNLFLFYDSKFVSSDLFSVSEFVVKVKKTEIKKENITLTFDVGGEIENYDILQTNIEKLKSLGFKTCLLNFSGSENELSLIPKYKADYLILDQKLTEGIVSISKENQEVISNIINVAEKVEAKVIAKGVKSFIIYKALNLLGIYAVYGDLVGSSTQMKTELTNEQKILFKK